ncbi:hypothetical protein BD309DRAFT_530472 [Dichomitus squalens]|nr:hypothetical protein BD309DRAFT_530472 [Dichomitus squalens]
MHVIARCIFLLLRCHPLVLRSPSLSAQTCRAKLKVVKARRVRRVEYRLCHPPQHRSPSSSDRLGRLFSQAQGHHYGRRVERASTRCYPEYLHFAPRCFTCRRP